MSLPNNGFSLVDVQVELTEANTSSSNKDDLENIYNYLFGSHSGGDSLLDLGGYGLPDGSSLSVTAGDGQVDLDYTIDDLGGFDVTVIAQYWDNSQTELPYTHSETTLNTYSTTGAKSDTLSGLTNGTSYDIRLFFINKFNNLEALPDPASADSNYPDTNTVSVTPEAPTYPTPTIDTANLTFSNCTIEWDYQDEPNDFLMEYRVNNGSEISGSLQSSNNWGTSSNPKEGTWALQQAPSAGDTVDVRIRAGQNSDSRQSSWSAWFNVQ